MQENKLQAITNLFQGTEIRSVWDNEKGDYYFSVIDVIALLQIVLDQESIGML